MPNTNSIVRRDCMTCGRPIMVQRNVDNNSWILKNLDGSHHHHHYRGNGDVELDQEIRDAQTSVDNEPQGFGRYAPSTGDDEEIHWGTGDAPDQDGPYVFESPYFYDDREF